MTFLRLSGTAGFDDEEAVTRDALDLDPFAATVGSVGCCAVFGYDAFQVMGACGGDQRIWIVGVDFLREAYGTLLFLADEFFAVGLPDPSF